MIDGYVIAGTLIITGWFAVIVMWIEYKLYQTRVSIPDKIIHIVYETSQSLKAARELAENVLHYVDDKDLQLEASELLNEINKAESK